MSDRSGQTELLVRHCLGAMEIELPDAHSQFSSTMCGNKIELNIDQESFAMDFGPAQIYFTPPLGECDIRVSCYKRTFLTMFDGKSTFLKAIRDDELELYGELGHLAVLDVGFDIFLRAGIMCPSFPGILHAYRNNRLTRSTANGSTR